MYNYSAELKLRKVNLQFSRKLFACATIKKLKISMKNVPRISEETKRQLKNCIAVIIILLLLLNGLTNELAEKSFCFAPDKNLFKFFNRQKQL